MVKKLILLIISMLLYKLLELGQLPGHHVQVYAIGGVLANELGQGN